MRLRKRERAKQPQRNRVPKPADPDRSKQQKTNLAKSRPLTKPTRRSRRLLGLPADPGPVLAAPRFRKREGKRPQKANRRWLEASSYSNRTESWVMQTALPKQISQSRSIMAPRKNTTKNTKGGKNGQATDQNVTSNPTSNTNYSQSQASNKTPKDKDWAQTLLEGVREGNKRMHLYTNDTALRYRGRTEDFLAKNSAKLLEDLQEKRRAHKDPRYKLNSLKAKLGRMARRPEVNVVHELQDLVCPPAEGLADIYVDDRKLGETYRLFSESWGEHWNKQIPMIGKSAPKPDYCVGFSRNAFSDEQRDKLDRLANPTTSFRPTSLICFPFLTCEAKALEPFDIAESQNCWSMFIAVRATVKLFEAANLQNAINREILAFSVGYNNREVEVHAYYPILDGNITKIFRREIHFSFLSPDRNSQDPWMGLDLIRNVYEIWAPKHLKRLRNAINAISQRTSSSSTKAGSTAKAPSELASSASDSHSSSTEVPSDARSRPRSSSAASKASNKRRLEDQPAGEPSGRKLRSSTTAQKPTGSTGMSFDAGALSLEESLEESIE